MANFRYFAYMNGDAVELTSIRHDGGGRRAKNFSGLTPAGTLVKATRMIEYKRFATRHNCDARCFGATGKIMKCECKCGGKNHGRGEFRSEEVAMRVAA